MVKKENSSLIELTVDEKKLFIQYWGGTLLAWIIAVQDILIILKIIGK